VEENRQLEYKRELPGTSDADKKEFVRDGVSFANSPGGHIIFGIAESNGIPTKPAPISEARIDEAKLRLGPIQGLKIRSGAGAHGSNYCQAKLSCEINAAGTIFSGMGTTLRVAA
jgi:hypothetical protein